MAPENTNPEKKPEEKSYLARLITEKCAGADCQNKKGKGEDYVGSVSKTKSGHTCQKWTSQSTHKHTWSDLGDNNYCRNPDGEQGVWCYTTNKGERWELCDVPFCEKKKKGKNKVVFYYFSVCI